MKACTFRDPTTENGVPFNGQSLCRVAIQFLFGKKYKLHKIKLVTYVSTTNLRFTLTVILLYYLVY